MQAMLAPQNAGVACLLRRSVVSVGVLNFDLRPYSHPKGRGVDVLNFVLPKEKLVYLPKAIKFNIAQRLKCVLASGPK